MKRLILTIIIWLTMMGASMAQTQITMLTQRKISNTTTTSYWNVPAAIQGLFEVRTDILMADLINPAKALEIRLEDDAGNLLAGVTWEGGTYLNKLGQPYGSPGFAFTAADIAGKRVRLVINPNSAITVGASLLVE